MSKIIFCDVDGVINRHQQHPMFKFCSIDKDLGENFNKLLWYTNSYFVLTSAWRYLQLGGSMGFDGLKNVLYSHWIDADRLIGVTEKDTDGDGFTPTNRGLQITNWLNSHKELNSIAFKYLVIDDMDLGITSAGHPFIKTVGSEGFTEKDLAIAVEMLK